MVRESIALSVYFSFYEKVKALVPQLDQNVVALFVGGFAGSSSWFLTYPLDVVKTQL
jgi:hypothetical protein